MQDEKLDLSLREATPDDESFLFEVYASTRLEELAAVGWDENQKRQFLRMQFLIRERGHARVDDRIVVLNERPVGRMLVTRSETGILLRDIALLPEYRNAGIGSRLIQDLMNEAAAVKKPIRLHVLASSPAVRFYERLAFSRTGADGAYLEMTWVPAGSYRMNPYVSSIENRLFPGVVQRAIFHRLTGDTIELSGNGAQASQLIERKFLVPETYDPLAPLIDQYVARPTQNPAVVYRAQSGEWILIRTSMAHATCSPKRDELPLIVEEKLSSLAADILAMADGNRTLRQIFNTLREASNGATILEDSEFRTAIDFLVDQERQLIKLTLRREDLDNPFTCVNIVPRNLYHSDRRDQPRPNSANEAIIDFHLHGIEDADWEFDLIEATVNHCFRFPHEALGGLDYGSRFCVSTLRPEVVPLLDHSRRLEVLEVGGGTGTFARSFIQQASSRSVNYHILDLSPALMSNQRKILSELLPESSHFHQDATKFDLPGQEFDLIIANEVIADFPVAPVQRNSNRTWEGDGAYYVDKYDLSVKDAPDSFLVNAGAFHFLERAWKHLSPGGTLIVSEYGSEQMYPTQCYHLNHEEFSIHFGHLAACAAKIGFKCRLLTLKEFMGLDDEVLVLNGREEHLLCLNHVLKNYGEALPYAVISKSEFEKRCQGIVEQIGLSGYSFSPLSKGFHFGPSTRDFLVLIMNKPG